MTRLLALTFAMFFLLSCHKRGEMACIAIRKESDDVEFVTKVVGLGFAPYDNPLEITNAMITGWVSRPGGTNCQWSRIVVHDQVVITIRDKSSSLHTVTATIIGKTPGKLDYGEVEIVIKSPEEAVVLVGERPANVR
jgi:hypothetical protein